METKQCSKCGEVKSIDEFYKNRGNQCKECQLEKNRRWRQNNPEKYNESNRKKWTKKRKEVIEAYGGKCECCGEDRYEFLAIDHINGGGRQHKKELRKKGVHLIYWLWRNNYPEGFRILCHNCNQALGAWGYCPHQRERE